VQQLSSNEIGEIVHLPPTTVRTRLARARTTLRAALPAAAEAFDYDASDLVIGPASGETGG